MSQFEKRKAKASEEVDAPEIHIETASVAPNYTQTGLDIFTLDGGGHYQVAEIKYNPETRQAEVVAIFDISRLVALSYSNQKSALSSLKKKK